MALLPYATIFTVMGAHKDAILAEGVRQASALHDGKPTAEAIKVATFGYARSVAEGWLLPGLTEVLAAAVDAHTRAMGPRPQTPKDDDTNKVWCDLFDEQLMDHVGQETLRGLGQDFIGEYFTDSEIDEPAVAKAAAEAGAKRLVEAAVHAGKEGGRKPGQVLAEIGITADDIKPFATGGDGVSAPAEPVRDGDELPRVTDVAVARTHVEQLVGRYAIAKGVGALDIAALAETLKAAFDDELYLALGHIEALGGSKTDFPYFACYQKAFAETCVEATVSAALLAAMSGQVVVDAVPAKKAKADKKQKGATTATPAGPSVAPPPAVASPNAPQAAPDIDHAPIIKALREARLRTDEDMGNLIGVSRAQVSNIANKGKSVTLDKPVLAKLKTAVEERIAELNKALADLG